MKTTIARRNRVWTPELRAQFLSEVDAMRQKTSTNVEAFSEIGPKWGLARGTVEVTYYSFRRGVNPHRKPVQVSKATAPAQTTDVAAAIKLLKAHGATITF